MSTILTPDQRLRVFVSSTMKELREERAAVRDAIQDLHMMPIMFDLGARAHPPQNLYRSYLAQSHVFVGIYWQEYGWIAPDMEISGVEDEYVLAGGMPKLIYIKDPAPDRSPELNELLERIRDDDRVSYKPFSDPSELRQLVSDDLAILLTERFYSAAEDEPATEAPRTASLPIQPTRFIGRVDDLDEITELIERDDVKLVTLVGPGGIGKTRLSIETARRLEEKFSDGLRFVPLAPLTDDKRFFSYLVTALELKENTSDPQVAVTNWLASKDVLLVLDNFEQLLDAADEVAELLEHAESSKILVTSRAVLRIRGEHEYPVEPLSLPRDVQGRIERSDAVALFAERAKEVRPSFVLDRSNEKIVGDICVRLDGLPLAIELGAARMKVLTPEQLFERLCDRLTLLTGGARDLPERQQTLRATIDWSYQLLDQEEKELFARLGVFRKGSTLDAIEDVCQRADDLDVLEALASLVEKSLLRQELSATGEARFWMLETIREFAAELLAVHPNHQQIRECHAAHYERLSHDAERGTLGRDQDIWMERVDQDYANILDASNFIFAHDKENGPRRLAKMCWALVLFAWVRNRLTDARQAAGLLLERELDDLSRAYALAAGGASAFWQGDVGEGVPMVAQAHALFVELGDKRGEGTCLLVLGMVAPDLEGPEAAKERLVQALHIFEELGDEAWLSIGYAAYCWTLMLMDEYEGFEEEYERGVEVSRHVGADLTNAMAIGNLAMLRSWQGRHEEALELHLDALRRLLRSGHLAAVTFTLANSAEVLHVAGDSVLGAELMGARESIYENLNVLDLSLMVKKKDRVLQRLREALGDDVFEEAFARGRSMSPEAAEALLANRTRMAKASAN